MLMTIGKYCLCTRLLDERRRPHSSFQHDGSCQVFHTCIEPHNIVLGIQISSYLIGHPVGNKIMAGWIGPYAIIPTSAKDSYNIYISVTFKPARRQRSGMFITANDPVSSRISIPMRKTQVCSTMSDAIDKGSFSNVSFSSLLRLLSMNCKLIETRTLLLDMILYALTKCTSAFEVCNLRLSIPTLKFLPSKHIFNNYTQHVFSHEPHTHTNTRIETNLFNHREQAYGSLTLSLVLEIGVV